MTKLHSNIWKFGCYPNTAHDSFSHRHHKHVPGDHNSCVTTFAGVVANELQALLAGPELLTPNAIAPHADFL
jgi:hypothetical protein